MGVITQRKKRESEREPRRKAEGTETAMATRDVFMHNTSDKVMRILSALSVEKLLYHYAEQDCHACIFLHQGVRATANREIYTGTL